MPRVCDGGADDKSSDRVASKEETVPCGAPLTGTAWVRECWASTKCEYSCLAQGVTEVSGCGAGQELQACHELV
eukprot:XP_001692130.1 predicted protein [Chlamydomonas reinhardtii]